MYIVDYHAQSVSGDFVASSIVDERDRASAIKFALDSFVDMINQEAFKHQKQIVDFDYTSSFIIANNRVKAKFSDGTWTRITIVGLKQGMRMRNKSFQSLEAVFITQLQHELEKQVKGRVSVYIKSDTLFVEINTRELRTFRYLFDGIIRQLVLGLTVNQVKQDVINKYKQFIDCVFFK